MEIDRLKQDKQAEKFLTLAKKYGVEKNFLFTTTFERYLVQLQVLSDLRKVIDEEGVIVTKEYVKNRKNIYVHPAISEYNKAVDSSNRTANILINIVSKMQGGKTEKNEFDAFLNAYNKKTKSAPKEK